MFSFDYIDNLSHDYNDKSQITWLHPRSLLSVSSDGTSIQVKALQTAINEEEARAQMEFLLPEDLHAKLNGITDHGVCRDSRNWLYTVYKIEMQCIESGNTWFVYRRYSEFGTICAILRAKGFSASPLPRKKYIGSSFNLKFVTKRQGQLANWLHSVLQLKDPASGLSIIRVEEFRRYITYNADSTPPTLHKIWPAEDLEEFSKATHSMGNIKTRLTLTDFELIRVIGKGSFGKVMLVRKKDSMNLYAMKVLNKSNVVKRKQVEHTRTERRVLGRTNHPFIVTLHYAFQTSDKLFFVLGELVSCASFSIVSSDSMFFSLLSFPFRSLHSANVSLNFKSLESISTIVFVLVTKKITALEENSFFT